MIPGLGGFLLCGLVGVLAPSERDPGRDRTVRRMAATLEHRGPDGANFAFRQGCALGFRRLAIIDPDAHEIPPFSSEDGQIWTVCNGEIYNADGLRADLETRGHRFRTHVDTEILPHLYEEHGADLVQLLDGMFAFAIWDERDRRLVLGRDRAGEKPLFYARTEHAFLFASELRALLEHPRAPRALDAVGFRRFMTHDFFPAPHSPLAGVFKLPAGHLAVITERDTEVRCYWDLAQHFEERDAKRGAAGIARALDERIAKAVERRRKSDVPVGVFLSGGIDSSLVLAHMAEQMGPGVPAFSLGHEDASFDEARYAKRTAEHFGADYHELILGRDDLEEGLRLVSAGFDEPLGDASIIPTHLLSRFARQQVKVVLSGEGSDELFGGYPTYFGHRVAEVFARLPGLAQRGLARAVKAFAPVSMGNVGIDYLVERFLSGAQLDRVERHHTWFGSVPPARHGELFSPGLLDVLRDDDPFASGRARVEGKGLPDALSELLYTDFTMYLQDGLLTKVDRSSMLASLEARAPFLDHELAEYSAAIPSRLKLRGKTGKLILRRAARGRLPKEVLTRRKRGFNIPFSKWLLEGLGERLQERFSRERVEARGLLSYEGMQGLITEHMKRRADHRKPLFSLLVFDVWCDRVFGEAARVPVGTGRPRIDGPLGLPIDHAGGGAFLQGRLQH